MRNWLWVVLVVMAACAMPAEEPGQTEEVISYEVYEGAEPADNTSMAEVTGNETAVPVEQAVNDSLSNASLEVPAPVNASGNATNSSNSTVEVVVEQLSIAKQHKMLPEIEALVEASPCVEFTWTGIEDQSIPVEVEQQLRFTYLTGLVFKGWVLSLLKLQGEVMASETVEVLVSYGEVFCVDEGNFTVDWEAIRRKHELQSR